MVISCLVVRMRGQCWSVFLQMTRPYLLNSFICYLGLQPLTYRSADSSAAWQLTFKNKKLTFLSRLGRITA